jgi:hypothetical protein
MRRPQLLLGALVLTLAGCKSSVVASMGADTSSRARPDRPWRYPLHTGITTTVFWCGEHASSANGYIANLTSAWDPRWVEHFGGEDDPRRRDGWRPAAFAPRENPFYVALPYNDFDARGRRRPGYRALIPWAGSRTYGATESAVKNRWIQVVNGARVCYAQWEDVGPYSEDDAPYVFGGARPKNRRAPAAGLDLSPATRDCLGVGGISTLSWRFVDDDEVPAGPWKTIVTTRNPR